MKKSAADTEEMELSERLSQFFWKFDAYFSHDLKAEQLLTETLEALEERIAFNEASMPVIMALGGQYDSDEDRAKIAELRALLDLMKARRETRKVAVVNAKKKDDAQQMLMAVFGISS